MPNAEQTKGKSKASKAKEPQLELELSGGAAAATADELTKEQPLEQQLEEQSTTKLKARSRFSAAFRSLSKSKGKKEKEKEKEKVQAKDSQDQEQLVISGAEDVTSIGDISTDSGIKGGVSKKKSLTRRLLLGSLRKSKVRPHSIATSDDISVLSSSRERLTLPSPTGSSITLQITISGKKVETVQSKGATSETDYLQPTPETTTTTTTTTTTGKATEATGSGKRATTTTTTARLTTKEGNTKLIVAKVSKEPAAKKKQKEKQKQREQREQPKATQSTASSLLATPPPLLEEKIVITESRRDTPPQERAPAKPSRAIANLSLGGIQSANSSGAVRKSSSQPSSQPSSSRLSLPSRKQRELMQEQQQRGHRLNRPFGQTHGTTEQPVSSVTALETPPSPESKPEPLPPTYPPPSPPSSAPATSTIVLVSLSDVEEQTDAVSLAESAGTPQVRFAVGSAVRGPAADADAYAAALAAAAAQQPSSSEEPSDSSLRRISFAQQQFAFSDHDSIEGRRETVRYQSVASEYNEDSVESEEGEPSEQTKSMPAFGDLTMDQEMEPTIMAPSSEKREHLYKILVIGELGTGKTSFIKRYVHQFFSQNYRATIGVDFALKVLHWDANTIVRLQLWDIAGQERFGNMTRVYYKEAVGAFIVFDVTRSGTFDCVSKWKEDLDSKVQLPDGSPIPCILLANKCDQEKQGIVTQPERMDEYVRENGFAGWFETSAKENINIDESARALVNKILINDKLITADANDEEKFNLSNAGDAGTDEKNKCSC
ncbi:nucleolar and coiled-body phosphoprotein 1 isoform X1 [Drosophila innubila]|uniref:nucleolar and coiled-body phosphoprotein 1 isoform X1 n=1 Tax=Drosophila innubila TaxID=198719 RepID=UPI00148CB314|nr:nucleolar and coiled-body phosphoprotein 1 isoform X1 [Drosophila innubila]